MPAKLHTQLLTAQSRPQAALAVGHADAKRLGIRARVEAGLLFHV
jgi:hypothetical protein